MAYRRGYCKDYREAYENLESMLEQLGFAALRG